MPKSDANGMLINLSLPSQSDISKQESSPHFARLEGDINDSINICPEKFYDICLKSEADGALMNLSLPSQSDISEQESSPHFVRLEHGITTVLISALKGFFALIIIFYFYPSLIFPSKNLHCGIYILPKKFYNISPKSEANGRLMNLSLPSQSDISEQKFAPHIARLEGGINENINICLKGFVTYQ